MSEIPRLKWFPKPMSAGDTEGDGQRKLLGKPNLDVVSLLIREAAQNSWDARLNDCIPTFHLRLRTLDDRILRVLRSNVFTEYESLLGLEQVLKDPSLQVLEINDRGTKGLGGPTQNDRPIPVGTPRDYVDFVLTVGAPQQDVKAGGTYGFGKTAHYLASECSTIIIWSRTRNGSGHIISRFIASAMGPSFARLTGDGAERQFTGRQWWAVDSDATYSDQLMFEPLEGPTADRLGTMIFEEGFEQGTTGTSIMVLAPKIPPASKDDDLDDSTDRLLQVMTAALYRNLWPKLGDNQPSHRRMKIGIWVYGNPINLIDPAESPAMDALKQCLDTIRETQANGKVPDTNKWVSVHEIKSRRPAKLLGHLAMTKLRKKDEDPLMPLVNAITYMRSEAELVVKTEPIKIGLEYSWRWVAVFKPVPELDGIFAESEPPAHDDWAFKALEDSTHRTLVKQALDKTAQRAKEYLEPKQLAGQQTGTSSSTGALSAMLIDLTGASGEKPQATDNHRTRSGRRTRKPSAPRARIVSVTPLRVCMGSGSERRQRINFEVTVSGGGPAAVPVCVGNLKFAVDGCSLSSENEIRLERWILPTGDDVIERNLPLMPGEIATAVISIPEGLAMDVSFYCKDDR